MSVGARVLKWQILRAYVKVPQPPLRIYSDPGSGLVTVDGAVGRNDSSMLWPDAHDGPGTIAAPSNPILNATISGSYYWVYHHWRAIVRSIMTFNKALIPPGADVTKATFNFYIYQCYDNLGCQPQWALVTSNPVAPNNLIPADYQHLGMVAISTVLDYAPGLNGTWQSMEVLPAYLSLVQPGGILQIGFREMKYDAANFEWPGQAGASSGLEITSVDFPTPGLWPYLEVTYNA
jgi:hypothetical protein